MLHSPTTRLEVSARPRRGVEETLLVQFPHAAGQAAALLWALPRQSRIRKFLVRRLVQRALEALNRKDFEAAFVLYHPDIELVTDQQLARIGFEERYRGLDERTAFQRRWLQEWGDFNFVPRVLVDLDERLFMEGRVVGAGASSGAGIDNYWAALLTISSGKVVREQFFFQKEAALQAAALTN